MSRGSRGRKCFFYGQYDVEELITKLNNTVPLSNKYILSMDYNFYHEKTKAYLSKSYRHTGNKSVSNVPILNNQNLVTCFSFD